VPSETFGRRPKETPYLGKETPYLGMGKETPHPGLGNETLHHGLGNETLHHGLGKETPYLGMGKETPYLWHGRPETNELSPAIPKGLRPPAQGCEARATLGTRSTKFINPNGVASIPRTTVYW
jgi:hypothetical protein